MKKIYIYLRLNLLIFYSKIILKIFHTTTAERLKIFINLIRSNPPSSKESKEMCIIYIEHYLKYIHTNYSFGQLFKNFKLKNLEERYES